MVCLLNHLQTSSSSPSWRPPLKSMLFGAKRGARRLSHVPLDHHSSMPSRGLLIHRLHGYLPNFSHPSPARAPLKKQWLTADHMPTFVLIQNHTNHNLSLEINTCSSWEIRVTLRNAHEERRNSEHRFRTSPLEYRAVWKLWEKCSKWGQYKGPSQSWSSVPSAASFRLRITPAMEKGEKRGPLKRQRRAQEEGREKGIAELHQATCNQDTSNYYS